MCFIEINPKYSKEAITSKVLFKGKNNQVTLFCMAAGTDIGEHTSKMEGYVYVIEGKGTFTLQGKDIAMKKGVIIHMGKNAVHELKAERDTAFLLFLSN